MDTKYDLPTNEGILAIARAVAGGSKLVVRGAALCNYTGDGMSSVDKVAKLKWNDIKSSQVSNIQMPCTSYLPSMVDSQGTETLNTIAALEIEFTYYPTIAITYNVVAVLADIYYPVGSFEVSRQYYVGDVVSVVAGNSTSYYRCKSSVVGNVSPVSDTTHWESVTLKSTLDKRYGNLQYSTITDTPVLLYVSKTAGNITISPQMEIDYMVRLYLSGVSKSSDISEYIVFDTLGPEFMASAQLGLFAQFAEQLRTIRDLAMNKIAKE